MNCPICTGELQHWTLGKKKDCYHYCLACEYLGKDPSLYVSPSREKARYLAHNNDPGSAGYRNFLNDFLNRGLFPYLAPPARVLDFGSGPVPALTGLLEERGFEVAPYDLYFAPHHELLTRRYHAITMLEVAEHLKDPVPVFTQLARCLLPGGTLSVGTLYHPGQKNLIHSWWYRQDFTHVGFYTEKTMTILAESCGLRVLADDQRGLCVLQSPVPGRD